LPEPAAPDQEPKPLAPPVPAPLPKAKPTPDPPAIPPQIPGPAIPRETTTPSAPAPALPPEPTGEVRRAQRVVGPAPTTEMEIAAWQVRLERRHFSMGTIDGIYGIRSRRAVTQFQKHEGLPVTGELDFETRYRLGMPGNPFQLYRVTADDMKKVQPTPDTWLAKADAEYLGYRDGWEMIAERFHSTESFMKALNPGIEILREGITLTTPQLEPALPLPRIDRIDILLSETTLLTYRNGQVMSCFPCSIARDKNKRPQGRLEVKNRALNPNYTFNPELFDEAAAREGITQRMIIPPGPNNPVGLAWIGLTLPGYGIHGTPEPTDISTTGSSGCFRLANWNAQKLLQMVSVGVPVRILP